MLMASSTAVCGDTSFWNGTALLTIQVRILTRVAAEIATTGKPYMRRQKAQLWPQATTAELGAISF